MCLKVGGPFSLTKNRGPSASPDLLGSWKAILVDKNRSRTDLGRFGMSTFDGKKRSRTGIDPARQTRTDGRAAGWPVSSTKYVVPCPSAAFLGGRSEFCEAFSKQAAQKYPPLQVEQKMTLSRIGLLMKLAGLGALRFKGHQAGFPLSGKGFCPGFPFSR